MKCDLHVHTNLSDGGSSVEEVFNNAIKNNVKIMSITDHNIFEAYKKLDIKKDISIITGIEISVMIDNIEYHFVMYGFDISDIHMIEYEDKVSEYNIEEFKKAVVLLREKYYLNIPEEFLKSFIDCNVYFDRMRLNKLLKELNIVDSMSDAYYLYTRNIPEHPRLSITVEELFELEKNTSSIVSIAHPTKYFKNLNELEYFVLNLKNNYGLKAVECITNRATIEEQNHLIKFCNDNNLYVSGGSDYHAKVGESESKQIGSANGDIEKESLTILNVIRSNNEEK
jgi:predicted metal-dependent phosphoesterase TrpH